MVKKWKRRRVLLTSLQSSMSETYCWTKNLNREHYGVHNVWVLVDTVYYYGLVIKGELNRRLIYECRCDERLKAKAEGSTRLAYTAKHFEQTKLCIQSCQK
jgi:hypothetical protein